MFGREEREQSTGNSGRTFEVKQGEKEKTDQAGEKQKEEDRPGIKKERRESVSCSSELL